MYGHVHVCIGDVMILFAHVFMYIYILLASHVIIYMHVLTREEKEGRKKQARSNKQQGKATQHIQGIITFQKK